MGNETTLRDIQSGLTGDRKQDAVYLLRQAARCRDSGYGEAIINEISRMIFSLIPGIDDGSLDRGHMSFKTEEEKKMMVDFLL